MDAGHWEGAIQLRLVVHHLIPLFCGIAIKARAYFLHAACSYDYVFYTSTEILTMPDNRSIIASQASGIWDYHSKSQPVRTLAEFLGQAICSQSILASILHKSRTTRPFNGYRGIRHYIHGLSWSQPRNTKSESALSVSYGLHCATRLLSVY